MMEVAPNVYLLDYLSDIQEDWLINYINEKLYTEESYDVQLYENTPSWFYNMFRYKTANFRIYRFFNSEQKTYTVEQTPLCLITLGCYCKITFKQRDESYTIIVSPRSLVRLEDNYTYTISDIDRDRELIVLAYNAIEEL